MATFGTTQTLSEVASSLDVSLSSFTASALRLPPPSRSSRSVLVSTVLTSHLLRIASLRLRPELLGPLSLREYRPLLLIMQLLTNNSTSTPISGTATQTAFTVASATVTTTISVPTTVYNIITVTTCPTASPTV